MSALDVTGGAGDGQGAAAVPVVGEMQTEFKMQTEETETEVD